MLCNTDTTLQQDMPLSMMPRYSQRLAEEGRFLRGRQERAVEREVSWGITKLRVDWDHAIFWQGVGSGGVGAKRAGAHSLCDE